jgi:low temperature requirement protein LtrA
VPDGEDGQEELRVSTLECFFDLVFVFAVTQLTSVLGREPDAAGLAKMALLLAVIWWMYGGYAWLTNVVAPVTPVRRALLGLGMAGFLVVALAAPTAFDGAAGGGLAFGIGYLVVNLVHAGLFLTSPAARPGMIRIASANVANAVVLVVAAFVPVPVRWALWVLVPLAQWGVPYLRGHRAIPLRPGHFVERNGLVLLIAFGESVAAIGVGLVDEHLGAGSILAAVLTLGVLLALWWSYFGGEDELAEQRLLDADLATRGRIALNAYGRAFYLLLAGIIVLAAGVRKAIAAPWHPGGFVETLGIAGGVVVYLVGDQLLRHTLRIGPWLPRCVAAIAVAATIGVGIAVSMIGQLVTIAVVLAAAFAVERLASRDAESGGERRGRVRRGVPAVSPSGDSPRRPGA